MKRMKWAVGLVGVLLVALSASGQDLKETCATLVATPGDREAIEKLRVMTRILVLDDNRALAGTLYSLACITQGDSRRASAAKAAIQKSFPASVYPTFLEPAFIGDKCKSCAGTGVSSRACTKCASKGKCTACGGRGSSGIPDLQGNQRPCMTCDGSGQCVVCTGSKIVAAACRSCSGGYVPSVQRAKETYLALLKHAAEGGELPQGAGGVLPAKGGPGRAAFGDLLCRLDALAQKVGDAPTTVLKNDALARFRIESAALFTGSEMRLRAEVKDIKMLDQQSAEIAFEDLNLGSFVRCPQKGMSLIGRPLKIKVPMSADRARSILPGQKITLRGILKYIQREPGAYSVPIDPGLLDLLAINLKGKPTYSSHDASICMHLLGYAIEGRELPL